MRIDVADWDNSRVHMGYSAEIACNLHNFLRHNKIKIKLLLLLEVLLPINPYYILVSMPLEIIAKSTFICVIHHCLQN